VAIELPYILFQTILYGVLIYSMIGFQWVAFKFLWFLFTMFCTFLTFTYYGMMAVSITPNSQVAAIVASAFYAIFNLFSGFLVPRPVRRAFSPRSIACICTRTLFSLS
jgi:ABC-type multidrug transport system permease subunit